MAGFFSGANRLETIFPPVIRCNELFLLTMDIQKMGHMKRDRRAYVKPFSGLSTLLRSRAIWPPNTSDAFRVIDQLRSSIGFLDHFWGRAEY